jgi:hypothetical protein
MFLLFLCTLGRLKFSSIAVVIYNGTVRSAGVNYGKKYALFGLRERPQDIAI